MPLFDKRIMNTNYLQVYKFLYYGLQLQGDNTYIYYDRARVTIILETNYKMEGTIHLYHFHEK